MLAPHWFRAPGWPFIKVTDLGEPRNAPLHTAAKGKDCAIMIAKYVQRTLCIILRAVLCVCSHIYEFFFFSRVLVGLFFLCFFLLRSFTEVRLHILTFFVYVFKLLYVK